MNYLSGGVVGDPVETIRQLKPNLAKRAATIKTLLIVQCFIFVLYLAFFKNGKMLSLCQCEYGSRSIAV